MKKNLGKIIVGVVVIVICALLVGFSSIDESIQYIRTEGVSIEEEGEYIINSLEELNDYYNTNKDKYDLEYREKKYNDQTIGFLNAIEKYDEEYFETKSLVFIVLYETSSDIRHKVNHYEIIDRVLEVNIETIAPTFVNCELEGWHIIIEIDKVDIDDVVVNIVG